MTKDEEIKLTHLVSLLAEGYTDLTSAVWEVLGESSYAFSRIIGQDTLKTLETEFKLKVDGQPVETVLNDISKIFLDEYGFMSDIQIEAQGTKKLIVKISHCQSRGLCDRVIASGVKKPFLCEVMCTCASAIERSGYKMRNEVEKWVEEEGTIITFTNVNA
jgi:hypothetical protein